MLTFYERHTQKGNTNNNTAFVNNKIKGRDIYRIRILTITNQTQVNATFSSLAVSSLT